MKILDPYKLSYWQNGVFNQIVGPPYETQCIYGWSPSARLLPFSNTHTHTHTHAPTNKGLFCIPQTLYAFHALPNLRSRINFVHQP